MKILYVTTISQTMNSFFKPHIKMLVEEGHQVDIACNYNDLALDSLYSELGCNFHQIDFSRSPLSLSNIKACKQLKDVVKKGEYDIVHCHTPNAAAVTRLVCRKFRKKNNLKVFYTAHGFHFYKGAPLKNWGIYYPIEKICSYFTDVILTMNQEDYMLATRKMKSKTVKYVHGVGLDVSKFNNVKVDRKDKRHEISVPNDSVLLISVGELIKRKNHEVILRSLARINNPNLHYAIVGKGPLLDELKVMVDELNIEDKVHFLGYRRDVPELYKVSDLCCFPSVHEGLPVALMEAMACGLPVVCSDIRGNNDLITNEESGFLVKTYDIDGYVNAINRIVEEDDLKVAFSEKSLSNVQGFRTEVVLEEIKRFYDEAFN